MNLKISHKWRIHIIWSASLVSSKIWISQKSHKICRFSWSILIFLYCFMKPWRELTYHFEILPNRDFTLIVTNDWFIFRYSKKIPKNPEHLLRLAQYTRLYPLYLRISKHIPCFAYGLLLHFVRSNATSVSILFWIKINKKKSCVF